MYKFTQWIHGEHVLPAVHDAIGPASAHKFHIDLTDYVGTMVAAGSGQVIPEDRTHLRGIGIQIST